MKNANRKLMKRQCPRCLNTDESYFYKGSRGWYCRRCIQYSRVDLDMLLTPKELYPIHDDVSEYTLQFALTKAQESVSQACLNAIINKDVLLYCVCGAGKTEMVVMTIAYFLKMKKKVCFAIPRRQVVLELCQRLQQIFKQASVIAVCAGYTKQIDGDLIVCTTHQLYRYYQAFDLLILDEPDAFPFCGNVTLQGIAKTACRGRTIYLTATPDDHLLNLVKQKEIVQIDLYQRPHGKPLPVPKVCCMPTFLLFLSMLIWLKKYRHQKRMVFVPTIFLANLFYHLFSIFTNCYVCTSKTEQVEEHIQQFKQAKGGIMFCTTILERGVTIVNVQVCVFLANHHVFTTASLVQIAGRAGRHFLYPSGNVLFLTNQKSESVNQCVNMLKVANQRSKHGL